MLVQHHGTIFTKNFDRVDPIVENPSVCQLVKVIKTR
jgi:hypothetical protein